MPMHGLVATYQAGHNVWTSQTIFPTLLNWQSLLYKEAYWAQYYSYVTLMISIGNNSFYRFICRRYNGTGQGEKLE